MSENITHTALLDDAFRIARHWDAICPAFKRTMDTQLTIARLGTITRWGDKFTIDLLTTMREAWGKDAPPADEKLGPRMAFVLGWLVHRAADRQMKPVFREVEPGRDYSPAECSVYNDAFLWHEVFNDGHEGPYHPAMFEEGIDSVAEKDKLNVAALETLLQALVQRSLLELHTFIPDANDIEGWIDRLTKLVQVYSVDRHRYAAAIANPDPEKVRKYLIEPNFYDRDDALIALARGIQREKLDPAAGDVAAAFDSEPASHYAIALKLGLGYLRDASAYFADEIDRDALHERLFIGVPGRDGKGV